MVNEIIIALVGTFTTFMSAFVTWLFARKKQKAEADSVVIQNLKESLEFYEKLSDDNKERLEQVLERNKELEIKIDELNEKVSFFLENVCFESSCNKRKRNNETKTCKKI